MFDFDLTLKLNSSTWIHQSQVIIELASNCGTREEASILKILTLADFKSSASYTKKRHSLN